MRCTLRSTRWPASPCSKAAQSLCCGDCSPVVADARNWLLSGAREVLKLKGFSGSYRLVAVEAAPDADLD